MKHVFIIAEAGVNHNGSIDLAEKLIDAAAEAGADAVKFQTFKAEKMISIYAEQAEYQKKNTGTQESQLEMIQKLELPFEQHQHLIDRCRQKGILFLSTPFDLASIDFLISLGLPLLKIPSGEITNLPYLRKINQSRKPVILSTGMASMAEVSAALKILKDCRVSLLHCTTEYPCPFADVNLQAMVEMKKFFKLPVGYSDHTTGIEVPAAAVALGAEIIEKHFTLNRHMAGPDHKASLEPDELKAMVSAIRHVEVALGDGIKKPAPSEIKNICIARKSIVASRFIKKGEVFSAENLTTKRPGNGLSPMKWDEVIGTTAQRDYMEDEQI